MQFLNSLTDNKLVTLGAAIVAFLVFAVLILLFVRLLFGNRLRMGAARGRPQRLGVVDAYDMDRQRQLVLVRRDNTEHLVLIGGPNDLLIESSIVRVEARERSPRDSVPLDGPVRVSVPEPRDVAPEPMRPPLEMSRPMVESVRVAPVAPPAPVATPAFAPTDAVPEPLPSADTAAEPVAMAEPVAVEPAARETRLPDLFARMRAGRAASPPPVADEPAPAPVPPPADAEFFETEIARALAPSLRERPAAPPPPPPPLPVAHMDSGAAESEEMAVVPPAEPTPVAPPPLAPPRAPFRPFPRREPSAALPSPGLAPGVSAAERPAPPVRPSVPRPPPPPFFTRMTGKAKEREEGSMPPVVEPAEGEAKAVSREPVTLFPEPNQQASSPAPRIDVSQVVAVAPSTAPRIEMPAVEPLVPTPAEPAIPTPAIREPERFREQAPVPAVLPSADDDAAGASEGADDPFAEEMARLLGRPPSKHG